MRRVVNQSRFRRAAEQQARDIGLSREDEFCHVRGELKIEQFNLDHVPDTPHDIELLKRDKRYSIPVFQPNLVVRVARKMMSRLVAGCVVKAGETCLIEDVDSNDYDVASSPGDLYISRMKFGSGGHNPSSNPPGLAVSPTPSDFELTTGPIEISAGVYHKTPDVTYPTAMSVQFYAKLEGTEANGGTSGVQPISEEVLMNNDAIAGPFVFARTTFNQLLKSSDLSFAFTHSILF
jgi:hypothetical protein